MFGISQLMCLAWIYKTWQLIDPEVAETTPGKAVGFLLIPIFDLFWLFKVLPGLSYGLEYTLIKHTNLRMDAKDTGYRAGMATAILNLCGLIPLIGFLFFFIGIVTGIHWMIKVNALRNLMLWKVYRVMAKR